jgi:hypothetical protein
MYRIIQSRLARTLGVFLLAGLLALLGSRQGGSRVVPMDGWEVEDLLNHLKARGVEFRAVPHTEHGPLRMGVYLTTTDKPRAQLMRLCVGPERIDEWEGTVYCGWIGASPQSDGWLEQFPECGERQGLFFFFGDPALRARINASLRDSACTETGVSGR